MTEEKLSAVQLELDSGMSIYRIALNEEISEAVNKICDTVNDTNTVYPGTNLRLSFKIATLQYNFHHDILSF